MKSIYQERGTVPARRSSGRVPRRILDIFNYLFFRHERLRRRKFVFCIHFIESATGRSLNRHCQRREFVFSRRRLMGDRLQRKGVASYSFR